MKSTRKLIASGRTVDGRYISVVVKKKGRQHQWGVLQAASPAGERRHMAYGFAGSEGRAAKDAMKAAKRLYPGVLV